MKAALHSFGYALDFLRDAVAGLSAAQMVAQPPGVPNHPAWLIGHLAFSCQELAGVLAIPAWLPGNWTQRYGPGSTPVPDAARYESKDRALAILADSQARITRAVAALDDAQLDATFPDPAFRHVFPTLRHALTQVLIGHTAYHVGQLSVWRKAMGIPPMTRSFE